MNDEEFRSIVDKIQDNKIKFLNLSFKKLNAKQVDILCLAIAKNISLISLNLRGTVIRDEGVKNISQNNSLIALNLSNCRIGSKAAKSLAKNTSLVSIICEWNHIDCEGAKAFARNNSLMYLDLYGNSIDQEGVKALAKNTSLLSLFFDYNNINDDIISTFIDIVLETPGSRIYETDIEKINNALKPKRKNFLTAAKKFLPGFYIKESEFNALFDRKIPLLFEKIKSVQCCYQIMQYFQSKNVLNPCKLDSTILPNEILYNILSFMYPTLAKNNGIHQSWEVANKKLRNLKFCKYQ